MTESLPADPLPRADRRFEDARLLGLALLVGALARAGLLVFTGDLEPRIVDEQHYVELATSLWQGHGFSWASGQPTSIRPPLYPSLLAGVWIVVGAQSLLAVRLVQMCLALVTVWLVCRLATDLFDVRTGVLAAFGVALYPSWLFANVTLLTETLFTFLVVLTVWLAHLGMRDSSVTRTLLAGFGSGLAALTRSVVWPIPLVVVPLLFLGARGPWRRRLLVAFIFAVGHLVVLAPWSLRNTRLQGVFTVVDTMSGFNLWMANSEATPPDRIWDAVGQGGQEEFSRAVRAAHPGRTVSEGEKDRWGRSAAFEYMLAHPGVTLARSVRKFADFWGLDRELVAAFAKGVYAPPRPVSAAISAATVIAYPAGMFLAVIGLAFAPKRCWGSHLLILGLILFVCAVHTIVFGHSRYRLPLMPFLLVYASAAMRHRSWSSLRSGSAAAVGAWAILVLLSTIWVQEVVVRDVERLRDLASRLFG